ncbi:hypothetical protein IKD49_01425 [Candidatus Saccharibacteria bacterium]|nr:hypothetical protein [Candidatus Saccharibacteria bacterium]
MKKTQKRILGFFGLMTVAVMTVVAVAIPNPGVSAVSGVTDTVVIRVVGDSPNVNIGGIEPGTVTINPQKDLTIAYENVGKVRIRLVYKDTAGVEHEFNFPEQVVDYGAGSLPFNINLSDPQYGYGEYTLTVIGEGAAGTDEDIIQFTYTPFIAELDEEQEQGQEQEKTYVDLDYINDTGAIEEDQIGEFKIEVFDKNGNLVTPLSPIKALPPEKKVNLPFEKYDLEPGIYSIKITAYNIEGNELAVRYLKKEIKASDIPPVPDTGRLFGGLNVSNEDFLITGLIAFLTIGAGGIVIINKRSKKNSRRR